MRRRHTALLALLVPWAMAATAAAQERMIVYAPDGPRVAVATVTPYAFAVKRGFGCCFACVELASDSDRSVPTRVTVRSPAWASHAVEADKSVLLGPHESARFWLPLPAVRGGRLQLLVQFDGQVNEDGIDLTSTNGVAGLFVGEDARPLSEAQRTLQALPSEGTDPPFLRWCPPDHVPGDWRLLTGYEVVLVDGACRLPGAAQDALRRFAMAGGLVVVADPPRLPAGPLRELCGAIAAGERPLALGACVPIGALGARAAADLRAALPSAMPAGRWPGDGGPVQPIPGLNEAPVRVFLVVMLLFALLAGPVNFLLLRKRRQPLLALVTVPVLGFGTTAAMLLFGLLHDGLGVRGVVRSLTVLDQARHESATLATHTLFAGLAPAPFGLAEDRLLLAPRAFERPGRSAADRWIFDATDAVLRGVLPAREPTPLLDARQGTARERLRVQVEAGALRVLADGGIAPLGEMLLRDADGRYWLGTAPSLQPCDAAAAAEAIQNLLYRALNAGANNPRVILDWSAGVTDGVEIRPNSWLAVVAAPPGMPAMPFHVDYDAAIHLVFGLLAAEDVVR